MAYNFIFWDNDGVLVDTEGLYYQASRETLEQIGYRLSPAQFAAVSLASGRSVFELATSDTGLMEDLRHRRNRRYAELLTGPDLLLPGVRETVGQLATRYRMAIVTSSRRDHFDIIHATTDLLQHFDFILCREDYHEAKPHPEAYLTALQHSGCEPAECLVIEDSPRGLMAAKAAGLTCWVLPSKHAQGQDFSAADHILREIGDVQLRLP